MLDFAAKYAAGLTLDDFLKRYANPAQMERWTRMRGTIQLSPQQRALLGSFRRELNVLCMAGAWCGDCIEQCPIFEAFEQACPVLKFRYLDRDDNPDLHADLSICGGARVPHVVFLSEDFQPLGRYGDRTLAKYRQLAADNIGDACPTGLVAPPGELTQAVTADWLDELERVQLICRLSPRLRKKHGD